MGRQSKPVDYPVCPYCGAVSILTDSKVVYGKSYGMIYLCRNYPKCDAYVGVHKRTNEPLGVCKVLLVSAKISIEETTMKILLSIILTLSLVQSADGTADRKIPGLLPTPTHHSNQPALADPIPVGFVEILRYAWHGHNCVVFKKSVGSTNWYRHYSDGIFECETSETVTKIWSSSR